MQVLSNSVAEALSLDADPSTTETQRFVRMFNKFFDLLNVRSLKESILHRKPDMQPYRDPNDERLKVHVHVYQNWPSCPPPPPRPPSTSHVSHALRGVISMTLLLFLYKIIVAGR